MSSVQQTSTEDDSGNDNDRSEAVERFYNNASWFTQDQLDESDVRESNDGGYIVVHIHGSGSVTSVSGYEIVSLHMGERGMTTVLYKER